MSHALSLVGPAVRKAAPVVGALLLAFCLVSVASAQGPTLPDGGYTPEDLTTVGGLAATRWGSFLAAGLLFMIAVGLVKRGVRMFTGLFGARRA